MCIPHLFLVPLEARTEGIGFPKTGMTDCKTKIPEMKLFLVVNQKHLEGVSVSSETDGPAGSSASWRDWNFVGSGANYFIFS